MSIFVSAGHSNTDPGAVANGRREADIAVEFRNMVAFYLKRDGVPHLTDGVGAENWPLKQAVKEAKTHKIAVEFHCNAAGPQATGVETLSAPKDFNLGEDICTAISKQLQIRSRGAKPENAGQHKRLAFVQAGGIVVELFFITNKQDLSAYEARKWLAAREVAKVLKEAHNAT
jgi:N-acetylmuramoyl-L-alanine amidase